MTSTFRISMVAFDHSTTSRQRPSHVLQIVPISIPMILLLLFILLAVRSSTFCAVVDKIAKSIESQNASQTVPRTVPLILLYLPRSDTSRSCFPRQRLRIFIVYKRCHDLNREFNASSSLRPLKVFSPRPITLPSSPLYLLIMSVSPSASPLITSLVSST